MPESCLARIAESLPVTAMLALSSGCRSEFFEVMSLDDRSDSLAVSEGTGEPS